MAKSQKYLTENIIRQDKFKKILDKAYLKDKNWLIKKSKNFRMVSCPACGSKAKKKFFEKNHFKFKICLKCSTAYISPRPSIKILKEFYNKSEGYKYWAKYTFKHSEKNRRKNLVNPRIKLINKYLKKYRINKNLALEVGPGYGTYSEALKKKKIFKKVQVVEANKDLVKSCQEKKLDVIEDAFENIKLKKKIDLLSSFEVIEHLFSPKSFLDKIHKNMSSRSLLFITCPNLHGFDNMVLGKASSTFDHEHLNYFTPQSIQILLNKSKFKILHLSTPGKLDVDLVAKYAKNNKNFLSKRSFFNQILFSKDKKLKEKFQSFLFDNCLSGHMLVIAKKINI